MPFSALCLGYKCVLYNCYRAPADFIDMLAEEQVDLLLGVSTALNGVKLSACEAEVCMAKQGEKAQGVRAARRVRRVGWALRYVQAI